MRIGIFSDSINIPPKEGINVHTYELARSLALNQAQDIVLFVCDRGWLMVDCLADEPFTTVLMPEEQFYDAEFIRRQLILFRIDVAQTYMTYFGATVLGPATEGAKVPMVAEFHDLEEDVVPLYFDDYELPQAVADHQRFQLQEARYADMVRVMSDHDCETLKRRWKGTPEANKVVWLPVAAAECAATSEINAEKRRVIVYIGNMSYAPNAEGAEIIRQHISPTAPDLPFRFIGRGSDGYASGSIHALGMVDDLEPHLQDAALGVSPIRRGSGMKIKNLTYLRAGIPVVTTSLGARGYPPTPAIIIEDDFTKWPQLLSGLLADTAGLQKLSKEARSYFERHFSADRVNTTLVDLYKDLHKHTASIVTAPAEPIDMRHVYWLREVREHGRPPVSSLTVIKGTL